MHPLRAEEDSFDDLWLRVVIVVRVGALVVGWLLLVCTVTMIVLYCYISASRRVILF